MKKLPSKNELVVTSNEPDAAMFRVVDIDGRGVGVIDAEIENAHPNQRVQWVDKSLLMYPSVGQLKTYNATGDNDQ